MSDLLRKSTPDIRDKKFRPPTAKEFGTATLLAVALSASSAEAKPVSITTDLGEKWTQDTSTKKTYGKNSLKLVASAEVSDFDDTEDEETLTSYGRGAVTLRVSGIKNPKAYARTNAFKSKVRRAEKQALNVALGEARKNDEGQKVDTITTRTVELTAEQEAAVLEQIKVQIGETKDDGKAEWTQGSFTFEAGEVDPTIAYVRDYKYKGAVNKGTSWAAVTEAPEAAYPVLISNIQKDIGPAPGL